MQGTCGWKRSRPGGDEDDTILSDESKYESYIRGVITFSPLAPFKPLSRDDLTPDPD
jgi:hypothetical protein